jgi:hypothetical protein
MTGGHHRPAEVPWRVVSPVGSAWFAWPSRDGVTARTATNVRAGGKPRVSVVHALTILLIGVWRSLALPCDASTVGRCPHGLDER